MKSWGIGILGTATIGIFNCGLLLLSNPVSADESVNSDVVLTIDAVIGLSVSNCDNTSNESIDLIIMPSSAGVFRNNCQTVSIGTNAPGYEFNVSVSDINLIYQNPLPSNLVTPPIIPPITTNLASQAPTVLTNDKWGFAAVGENVTLTPLQTGLAFDSVYNENDANGKYSGLPTTETTIYTTDTLPGQIDEITFYYGARVTTAMLAGLYQTTVTYTAIANDVPEVPQGFYWKQVSAGGTHTCAIGSDDFAYCWGDNGYGQLGVDTVSISDIPLPVNAIGVLSNKTIIAISAGQMHTCAIANDNKAYCWGQNFYGSLGDGNFGEGIFSLLPVAVDTSDALYGRNILSISAGDHYTCAVASDMNAYCWGGSNGNGKIGVTSSANTVYDCVEPTDICEPLPVAVDTSSASALYGKTVLSISAGFYNTCAIANDENAYCWGDGSNGRLGDGSVSTTVQFYPVPVDTSSVSALYGKTVLAISVGGGHACSIGNNDYAYCWGNGDLGSVGDGNSTIAVLSPVAVDTSPTSAIYGKTVLSISAGQYHTCIVAIDNNAYCWGYNNSGQIGDNTIGINRLLPTAVDKSSISGLYGKTVQIISSGSNHTCAIASDKQIYCWGINISGQLGDGSYTDNPAPVKVETSHL